MVLQRDGHDTVLRYLESFVFFQRRLKKLRGVELMVTNTTAENQFILIDCPLCNYEACLNLVSITSFCVLLLTS